MKCLFFDLGRNHSTIWGPMFFVSLNSSRHTFCTKNKTDVKDTKNK